MDKTIITSAPFGVTKNGEAVTRWTLKNAAGMQADILDYGCTVQRILVPDSNGEPVDVALGYDDLAGYEQGSCFFGAFIGRYANRIKGAAFELNGRRYTLEKNDGENHLHGVYCTQVFAGEVEGDTLVFRRVSPDGEEGYPGTLTFAVRYRLTADNTLEMDYRAVTDADTVVNFTNHTYFNLNGAGDILGHRLTIHADRFAEGNAETLPTGRILQVQGTPMDFRAGRVIGDDINADWPQIQNCRGYDHCFVLNGASGTLRKLASAVWRPAPPSPPCSFIPATSLTWIPRPQGRAACAMAATRGSAWKASITPAAPISRTFPQRFCARGRNTTK